MPTRIDYINEIHIGVTVEGTDPFRAALRRARVVPLPEVERRFLESIERRSTTKISLDDLVYRSKQ